MGFSDRATEVVATMARMRFRMKLMNISLNLSPLSYTRTPGPLMVAVKRGVMTPQATMTTRSMMTNILCAYMFEDLYMFVLRLN